MQAGFADAANLPEPSRAGGTPGWQLAASSAHKRHGRAQHLVAQLVYLTSRRPHLGLGRQLPQPGLIPVLTGNRRKTPVAN